MTDRETILKALREKPLKVFEVMRRANIPKEEACQALLLKMRDEGRQRNRIVETAGPGHLATLARAKDSGLTWGRALRRSVLAFFDH